METTVPTLFVIGQNGSCSTLDDMEDFRERIFGTETGLVVVGGANDNLVVGNTKKRFAGITQAMVDRCIAHEISLFLSAVISPHHSGYDHFSLGIPSSSKTFSTSKAFSAATKVKTSPSMGLTPPKKRKKPPPASKAPKTPKIKVDNIEKGDSKSDKSKKARTIPQIDVVQPALPNITVPPAESAKLPEVNAPILSEVLTAGKIEEASRNLPEGDVSKLHVAPSASALLPSTITEATNADTPASTVSASSLDRHSHYTFSYGLSELSTVIRYIIYI